MFFGFPAYTNDITNKTKGVQHMKGLMKVKEKYNMLSRSYEKERQTEEGLKRHKAEIGDDLIALEAQEQALILKKELLEEASERAREDGMKVLADTATNAVQAILGDDTSVDMVSSIKRGVPQVDVVVKREKNGMQVITDPTQGEGGGVADIVSLAMFFSLGLLVGQDNEAPLFLDEPTKFLSKGYSSEAASFINDMVEYTDKQTFMVTHDETIASSGDMMFRAELNDNLESVVSEL